MRSVLSAERLAYRPAEFARATGLSLSTVKREIYDGKLKAIRKRGAVIIPAEAAREYLSGEKKEAQTSSESVMAIA
jgi:hypothetical protein